jgi:hypothetical protein
VTPGTGSDISNHWRFVVTGSDMNPLIIVGMLLSVQNPTVKGVFEPTVMGRTRVVKGA